MVGAHGKACRRAAQTAMGNCHIAINNPNPELRLRDAKTCYNSIRYAAKTCLGKDVFISAPRVLWPSISNPPYGEYTSLHRPQLEEDFEEAFRRYQEQANEI